MKRVFAATISGAALTVLVPSLAQAAPVVVKGPYAQDVSKGAVTIMWELSEAAQVILKHGYAPEALDAEVISPAGVMHEVRLSGLEEGRALYYRLGGAEARQNQYAEGGANSLSGMVQLPPIAGEWRFVVVGDTRSGHDTHHAITRLVAAEHPSFVINTGDLVSDGLVEENWGKFFDIEHDMLVSTALFPVIGNHDSENGTADLYFKYFSPPKNPEGTEAYYKVRYGNVLVLVLDSEVATYLGSLSEAQKTFIETELRAAARDATIEHRFAAIHQGPYASDPDRSGNASMRAMMDVFGTGLTNSIFSGHDHNYERGRSENGVTYVVTGGGGASLYDVGAIGQKTLPPHEVFFNKKDYNYVLVTVDGLRARFEAKDLSGTLIDMFEYTATPVVECAADPDCADSPKAHDDCAGAWKCAAPVCEWVCEDGGDGGTDASVVPDAAAADTAGAPDTGGGGAGSGGGADSAGGCGCSALGL